MHHSLWGEVDLPRGLWLSSCILEDLHGLPRTQYHPQAWWELSFLLNFGRFECQPRRVELFA